MRFNSNVFELSGILLDMFIHAVSSAMVCSSLGVRITDASLKHKHVLKLIRVRKKVCSLPNLYRNAFVGNIFYGNIRARNAASYGVSGY